MDIKIFNKETEELIDEWKENKLLEILQEEVKVIEGRIKEEEKKQEYKRGMRRETMCIDDGVGIEMAFDLREILKENNKDID